jgi:hypothetical protein
VNDTDLKPTAGRVALARGMAAKRVRHYNWPPPDGPWTVMDGHTVTADTTRMVKAGLADIQPSMDADASGWLVELTDAGWAWLDRHGGA